MPPKKGEYEVNHDVDDEKLMKEMKNYLSVDCQKL